MLRQPILTLATKAKIAPDTTKEIAPPFNPYGLTDDLAEFIGSCRIRSGAGFVLFKPYDYQKELLEIINTHSGIIIIKDRQLGITEILAARSLYRALVDPAYTGAFVSIGQDKSSDIRERAKGMPTISQLEWEKNSGKALKPVGGGSILFLPSTDNAARGLPSVTELVFDEAGFPRNFTELYGAGTAAQEMVPQEIRKTIICTTIPEDGEANAVWGMFAADNDRSALEALRQARVGDSNCNIPGMVWWTDANGWAKVVIGHKVHPKYGKDPSYIDSVIERRKIPRAIAEREHNLGIEQAGSSLFNSKAIEQAGIGSWSDYVAGRKYMATVDPNFGGHDRFVCLILDITEPSQTSIVAEYALSDKSVEYSESKTLELCDRYRVVACAIESNSGGKIVIENLARRKPSLELRLTNTTHQSKITNTDRVALAVEQLQLIYPKDWQGIPEMRSFSARSREAIAGEYDDRVMALAAGFAHLEELRNIRIGELKKGAVRR